MSRTTNGIKFIELVATESSIIPTRPIGKIQVPPILVLAIFSGRTTHKWDPQPFEIGILGQSIQVDARVKDKIEAILMNCPPETASV